MSKYDYEEGRGTPDPRYVDEWGDPIPGKEKSSKRQDHVYVDEWGDPVKRIDVGQDVEEYVSDRDKILLEKQLVKTGKIYPRAHYQPRGTFRGILAVCLAFFFGILCALGALIGCGVFFGTKKSMKDVFGWLGVDVKDYIDEDYVNLSILDFAKEVASLKNANTLGDIAKYTPLVDQLIDRVNGAVKDYGITLSAEDLKGVPFNMMEAYFTEDVLKTVELGKVMQVSPDSDYILLALCYGKEGEDYTVEGGNIVCEDPLVLGDVMSDDFDFASILNDIELAGLMELPRTGITEDTLKEQSMMYALCYGSRGVDYEIENGNLVVLEGHREQYPLSVGYLQSNAESVMNSLYLGDLMQLPRTGLTEAKLKEQGMMYTLCYGSRGKDYDIDEDGNLFYPDTKGENYPLTLGYLQSNAESVMNSLPLGDLMQLQRTNLTDEIIKNESMMYALCYGSRGKDYDVDEDGNLVFPETKDPKYPLTLGDFQKDAQNILQDLEVESLLGIDGSSDKTLLALAYGSSDRYTIGADDKTVTMNTDPVTGQPYPKRKLKELTSSESDFVKEFKIGDIMETANSKILQALEDKTIGDLEKQETLESLKLDDLIDTSGSPMLKALKDKSLKDLENHETIDNLLVGDLLNTDGSKLLYALKDKKIKDLENQETLESLKIGDIIDLSQGSSALLSAIKDWKISDLKDENRVKRLHIGQVVTGGTDDGLLGAISSWRIEDLSNQEKINSLKLGDVLKVGEGDTLLAALQDISIGNLQEGINKIALKDLLSEEAMNNKILSHLADCTIENLSEGLSKLTIGEVFADQVYSYMEISGENTYAEMYETYKTHHSEESYNPDRLGSNGKPENGGGNTCIPKPIDTTSHTVQTYWKVKANGKEVIRGYFTKTGDAYTMYEGGGVKRDPTGKETPYYYEAEVKLVATPTYSRYSYSTGETDRDIIVEERGGKLYDGTYELTEDGFGGWTYTDGSGNTVEVDCTYTFTLNGKRYTGTYTEREGVFYGKEAVLLYERYYEEGAPETSYGASETEEHYRYQGSSGPVELDRYLRGVWFLLLAEETDGGIVYHTDKAVLDLDGLITGINSSLTSFELWKLYFHGLLTDNPYTQLPKQYEFHNGGDTHEVDNLNELRLSELVAFVNELISP